MGVNALGPVHMILGPLIKQVPSQGDIRSYLPLYPTLQTLDVRHQIEHLYRIKYIQCIQY